MEVELDFLKYWFETSEEYIDDDEVLDTMKAHYIEEGGILPKGYNLSHVNKIDSYTLDPVSGRYHRDIGFGIM